MPGLEESSSDYNVRPDIPTKTAIQNFIKGGADFNAILPASRHPDHIDQNPVSKEMASTDSASLLTTLQHMNGFELLELLNKALRLPNSKETDQTNHHEMKGSVLPNIPVIAKGRGNQPFTSGSSGTVLKSQTNVPVHSSLINSNLNQQHAMDSSRQNALIPTNIKNTVHPIRPNSNAGLKTSEGNTESNKMPLQSEGNRPIRPKETTTETDFHQNNSGAVGSQVIDSVNNPNNYNSAQLYTNPMAMLTAGMGTSGGKAMGNDQSIFPDGNKDSNTAEIPGFDPNRLMSSWTNTHGFNPEKYNVGQNFISAEEWTRYANQPTGYTGLMHKLSQGPRNSFNPSTQPRPSNHSIPGNSKTDSSSNFIPHSALYAKMNFIPNNMILSNSQAPNMNVKFDFDPDRLNSFQGTFHPGQFASASRSNTDEAHVPTFDADAVNQLLMGLPEDGPSMQNQQLDQKTGKKPVLNYDVNPFNKASMSFSPDLFLSPMSQLLKNKRLSPNLAQSRRSIQDWKKMEINDDQNGSTSTVLVQTGTTPVPTTRLETKPTQPPVTPKTTQNTGYAGFDPDEINKPIMYNPDSLPGINMGSFQTYPYNSQNQHGNINSTENKYTFTVGGFNPSQFNHAKMSFDVNSQLGIGGGSNSFTGQSFSGGYDPIKTNIMAIQNPFAVKNDSHSQSFTAGAVSGYESAFIGSFNPNSVNQGMMQTLLSSKNENESSTGGNYFGMGGFDMSGFGGNFDPSTVNNAVFNPNEVNKVQMHFNPSEMLDKNPGYDTDKALGYKFDPNHINNMQMHFQPTFLQNNNGVASNNDTNSVKPKSQSGSEFVPGLLGGGNKNGIPMFNPDSVNNAHMNFDPIGVNSQGHNPMNNTQTSNTTATPNEMSTLFNPDNVNNAKMNFNPDGILSPQISQKVVRFGSSFTPGRLSGGGELPENSNKQEETNEPGLRLILNNP